MLLSTLLWLLAIELIGIAALPLAHRLFSGLPDRGYASAKILGLVVVAYLVWSTGMLGLTAFTGATIGVFAVGMGVIGWRQWGERVRASWSEARSLIVAAEAVFLAVFALGVWIRSYNAAIAGTEKPMDFAFLHSLIRAQSLPAEDLWLAGYGLPYYYFGYLVQSLVAKIVAVEPAVACNLAVVTVFALSALGAFGLVASLARLGGGGTRSAIVLGGLAGFALMVMGNLQAAVELLASWGLGDGEFWKWVGVETVQTPAAGFPPSDWGWWFRAARVIPDRYIPPDGITEFPYFSFLLGDLHPHYMAIPLGVLVVTLAVPALAVAAPIRADRLRFALTAIVLGAVIPSNTWDVPVLWGLFGLAFLAGAPRAARPPARALRAQLDLPFDDPRLQDPRATPVGVLASRAVQLALLGLLAAALYLPYFVGFSSQPLGVEPVTGERTPLGSLLVLFGPLLVLPLVAGLLALARQWRSVETTTAERVVALGGFAVGILLVVLREPALGLLVASLGCWLTLAWARCRAGVSPSTAMAALIVVVGLGSILVPEVVFLRDAFGTRMNTVFKLYYDAWILLAVAAPLLAWELLGAARSPVQWAAVGAGNTPAPDPRTPAPWVWPVRITAAGALGGAALLTMGGVLYPLAATHTKSGGFAASPTLDGMAYLRSARPDDAAAIDWLRTTHPRAGVVEAVRGPYSEGARFATFAAAPTLVGWGGHEVQWRGPLPEIGRREDLARRVYVSPIVDDWSRELGRLGIRFIVLGDLERETYRISGQSPFEDTLAVAARFGRTRIYELKPARREE